MKTPTSTPPADDVLTAREVAILLGKSSRQVQRYAKDGDLEPIRRGSQQLLFYRSTVSAFQTRTSSPKDRS